MKFRIYYGDGSTYEGDPFLAPSDNVQVIAQEDVSSVKGWILMHGLLTREGFYCWRADGYGWDMHETAGFWDYLYHYRGPKHVIFGRTIPTAAFHDIIARAGCEGLGDG